jgi:hypothetical protein
VDQEIPRHEKVSFRREEIAPLEMLPSAAMQESQDQLSHAPRGGRFLLWGCGVLAGFMILFVGVIYVAGLTGIGSERLRREAEAAINAFAGADIDVASGSARLSLDGSRFVGLDVPGMRLTDKRTGEQFAEAGSLRFGLRLWPLLSGEIQLRSVRLADARILAGAAPDTGERDWSAQLRDAQGLLDPDLVVQGVFAGVHRLFDLFETQTTRRIELSNVDLMLADAGEPQTLRVTQAVLSRNLEGQLEFSAELAFAGRSVKVDGSAARAASEQRITSLDVRAVSTDAPAAAATASATAGRVGIGRLPQLRGPLEAVVTGEETPVGGAGRLAATIRIENGMLEFRDGETVSGSAELAALLVAGSGKVEVERLRISSGRSRFLFNGAVGPAPFGGAAGEQPAYRYELVSNGSTVGSRDAPEPAVEVGARIAGTYLPAEKRLNASEIGVRTPLGGALGTASIDFADDRTPSLVLALDIPSMPVAHVKQLWPWPAARKARAWVMKNAFGGMVKNSRLRLSVEPGRLGDGIPLRTSEITGHFEIADARFDMAGELPPVRDAHGTVDFRGTNIDIALSSGTVFLPNGRTVAASGGTFTIRDAHVEPVVGKLDIDLSGEAAAVVELASYKPIEAMKNFDLRPADFEGELAGNVKADIPLARDIPVRQLGWSVALNYSGLSVAKPLDGHMVTEAEGTIEIDPTKAVIKAKAQLNGMPAELDLVEPLGASAVERRRDVAVTLDDKARDSLAPGLNAFLSGPVLVDLEGLEGTQSVTADLTQAKLMLPFAGWTKGAGVPATASFKLLMQDDGPAITDFMLDGQTFGATGEISIAGGGLAAARFGTVRLNREDSVSIDVRRSGEGYAIRIQGDALDARPLIKQITADAGKGGPAGKSVPVTIDADVKRVTGFGGEVLQNVQIAYNGAGSKIRSLTVSAVSTTGGAISIMSAHSGKNRTVQMQSADAGALLRFLDIYGNMEGGSIRLALDSAGKAPLRGQIDARDFWLVDEPRLGSMVSTAPAGGRSLNQAVRRDIDTSRVRFDRGFAQLEKGEGYLSLANGMLRGPLIGTTFQGTLFDPQGNMSVTGTFMPAYGLNRLFAEIPLIGAILGNGRDRGLIGITYKLAGDAKEPRLQVNPLSAVAPGIFRQIFEFN